MHVCKPVCSEPCVVCATKCTWECAHQGKCELSYGIPYYRLPCNKRSEKKLEYEHLCLGVCGEVCPSKNFVLLVLLKILEVKV